MADFGFPVVPFLATFFGFALAAVVVLVSLVAGAVVASENDRPLIVVALFQRLASILKEDVDVDDDNEEDNGVIVVVNTELEFGGCRF